MWPYECGMYELNAKKAKCVIIIMRHHSARLRGTCMRMRMRIIDSD